MFLSFKKKKAPEKSYDTENLRPVIRVSICTGEQTAGFKNIHSGKFTEIQLLKSPADLLSFMETYGIEEVPPKEY